MTRYTATIVTANIRDLDNCDNDNAIDAIYAAARRAAEKYAEITGVDLTVEPYSPAHENNSKTVIVSHDCWGRADMEETMDADLIADEIRDDINDAIDQAIQDGDWENDFAEGDRIEAGEPGTEDYDTGVILTINGDRALVGWDTGTKTWARIGDLRPL